MGCLSARSIDCVHLRNSSEKAGQRGEAIHDRLVVALNQEGDRAHDRNHALQAFALDAVYSHCDA